MEWIWLPRIVVSSQQRHAAMPPQTADAEFKSPSTPPPLSAAADRDVLADDDRLITPRGVLAAVLLSLPFLGLIVFTLYLLL
jgi:hypothetical protein